MGNMLLLLHLWINWKCNIQLGQAHYSWPLNFHTNASFSYVLLVSNMISKGYKSSKGGIGQKLIYPLSYDKINTEVNQLAVAQLASSPKRVIVEVTTWWISVWNASHTSLLYLILLPSFLKAIFPLGAFAVFTIMPTFEGCSFLSS